MKQARNTFFPALVISASVPEGVSIGILSAAALAATALQGLEVTSPMRATIS